MTDPVYLLKNDTTAIDALLELYKRLLNVNEWEMRQSITGDDTNKLRSSHGLKKRSFANLTISKIPDENYEEVFKFIPAEILSLGLPKILTFFVSTSGEEITAHIDRLRRTALNIYLSNINSKTIFYRDTESEITTELVKYVGKSESGKQKWFPEEHKLIKSHVYEPTCGDFAILNVRKPHSVAEIKGDEPRIVLSVDLPRPFDMYRELYKS